MLFCVLLPRGLFCCCYFSLPPFCAQANISVLWRAVWSTEFLLFFTSPGGLILFTSPSLGVGWGGRGAAAFYGPGRGPMGPYPKQGVLGLY